MLLLLLLCSSPNNDNSPHQPTVILNKAATDSDRVAMQCALSSTPAHAIAQHIASTHCIYLLIIDFISIPISSVITTYLFINAKLYMRNTLFSI